MAGWLRSEENAERRNRCETLPSRTCVKSRPSLHKSAFRPVLLRLSMDTHDDQHNFQFLNLVPKPDETPDPIELLRGISDVAVKCFLSCVEI